jgi:hypothetical protein
LIHIWIKISTHRPPKFGVQWKCSGYHDCSMYIR